jgi:hypothetical protein
MYSVIQPKWNKWTKIALKIRNKWMKLVVKKRNKWTKMMLK